MLETNSSEKNYFRFQLSEPVDVNSVKMGTICLPQPGQNFTGQNCVVSGWGRTSWRGSLPKVWEHFHIVDTLFFLKIYVIKIAMVYMVKIVKKFEKCICQVKRSSHHTTTTDYFSQCDGDKVKSKHKGEIIHRSLIWYPTGSSVR